MPPYVFVRYAWPYYNRNRLTFAAELWLLILNGTGYDMSYGDVVPAHRPGFMDAQPPGGPHGETVVAESPQRRTGQTQVRQIAALW